MEFQAENGEKIWNRKYECKSKKIINNWLDKFPPKHSIIIEMKITINCILKNTDLIHLFKKIVWQIPTLNYSFT